MICEEVYKLGLCEKTATQFTALPKAQQLQCALRTLSVTDWLYVVAGLLLYSHAERICFDQGKSQDFGNLF